MTYDERAYLIKKHIDACYRILTTKGVEYANNENDPNANFKDTALKLEITPEKVLFVYLQKHLTCVERYCAGKETLSNETIESRIHDAINYLLILATLIETKDEKENIQRDGLPGKDE